MNLLSQAAIKRIAHRRDHDAATIYLPTEEAGLPTRKSPILFKNLIRQTTERLQQGSPVLSQLERSCLPLIEDHDFWQLQTDGLAVLCGAAKCDFVHLPFDPPAGAYVGGRFHIKPLLYAARRNRRYYVLCLSVNRCRLLRGDVWSLEPVEVASLPQSLEEALRFDDPEKSLQFHSSGAQGGGQPIYHGQGSSADSAGDRLLRYFQACAGAVDGLLTGQNESAPLVLAAVDEHVPVFREVSSYAGLIENRWLAGNPDDLSIEDIHARSQPLIQSLIDADEAQLLQRFEELRGSSKVCLGVDKLMPAIVQGRVETAIVAADQSVAGSADLASGEVCRRDDWGQDLLNDCAAETMLHGGESYVMSSDALPHPSLAAAILRY